ncbi:hypothetical protein [Algoriphagus sp.]|uniref:hypothetical protein n=1 Tax=Algoriphagus sp. TaxID=1872435 RepID=UPI0026151ECE|nr:hypothetical protein [Algoriphagus sp.]
MKTMKLERKKRIIRLAVWTWTWVATLAMATFGPKFIWDDHIFLTTFAITVNLINGILMISANRDLFNHFDEFERKIHLEAMALTLGLSVVIGLTYSLLDTTNLISGDAEISFLVMFIGITYLISTIINLKRFQ